MDVVIAGGHGKIALLLAQLLSERGDRVRSLVRNPDHAAEVGAAGAEAVVHDLEGDEPVPLQGADAVVFAAGAGPGSGAARKWTVDHGAAIKLADACREHGVRRYVVVSAMGVDGAEPTGDEQWDAYVEAKAAADRELLARDDLEVTVIRPGRLTDDAATDRVLLADHVDPGAVPRADVAAVLALVLATPATAGVVAELVTGPTPIAVAVRGLTG